MAPNQRRSRSSQTRWRWRREDRLPYIDLSAFATAYPVQKSSDYEDDSLLLPVEVLIRRNLKLAQNGLFGFSERPVVPFAHRQAGEVGSAVCSFGDISSIHIQ